MVTLSVKRHATKVCLHNIALSGDVIAGTTSRRLGYAPKVNVSYISTSVFISRLKDKTPSLNISFVTSKLSWKNDAAFDLVRVKEHYPVWLVIGNRFQLTAQSHATYY